jgi:predicted ester cyclase
MPTREERNKATVRQFEAALEGGDPALSERTIDEVVDPDALIRTPLPINSTGPAALKEIFGRLHSAFPDLHIEIKDLIAERDKVVSRNTVSGTHRGEYMGLAPTGRAVTYDEIFIVRFSGEGRIVETWGVVDVATQMRQLGLIPG